MFSLLGKMRPSLPRLVRILPRSQLSAELPSSAPPRVMPGPHRHDTHKITLIEMLQQRKKKAGTKFPTNIRIEPVVPKQALKNVSSETRQELKELLKER